MKLIKAVCAAVAVLAFPVTLFAQAQLAAPVRWSQRNLLNCYDQQVDMKVLNGNDVAGGYPGTKRFLWEYTTDDPSVTINPVYTQFAQSQTDSVYFFPYLSFPPGQANQINTQQFRYIRAKLAQVHPVTGAVLATVAVSNPTPVKFSPSRPFSNSPEVLATGPSCGNTPTGVIYMDITKYTDTVMYIVRYGSANGGFCNPETGNPPCFNVAKSGRATTNVFSITGIPAGTYTVLLANTGTDAGACYETYAATVGTLSPVRVDTSFTGHPGCNGDSTGNIRLLVGGGDSATYRFAISPAQPAAAFTFNNGEAKWNGLKAGNYTVTFSDTCGLAIVKNFTITQPPKVTGSVLITVPTCAAPGNGTIRVKAKYSFASPGFALFNYRVWKNGLPYDSLLNTADTLFAVPGLQTGSYRVTATSPNTPGCPGIDEAFPLPFNALSVTTDSVKAVDCNGGTDGYIRIKATGGSGLYSYFLRKNGSGFTFTDSTGTFTGLAAGSYTGRAVNKMPGCNDSATININIAQPDTIAVNIGKTDVQCKGMDNGTLTATANGGNGSYEFKWQVKMNGNWAGYFQTGGSITNVPPGIYRSAVRDIKNCTGYSLPVTIFEPDSLRIDSIKVNDIPCFAGSGNITLYTSGGNPGHTQQYRLLPGISWIDFTPATGLTAGQYMVRAVDAKGCIATRPDTIAITSPPNTLDFTYSQVFYNGYNITCFGASNGIITLNASGGNGGGYSGYMYRYDNTAWQTGNVLTGIPGGNRNVQVRDARGCVVNKTVLFLEPSDSLKMQLVTKTDITCHGAATGKITVKATGGAIPYRYQINGGGLQSDSNFINLPAGVHTVAVKDTNGCMGFINVTLLHLNPQINSAATTSHVSCNGGNDGSINTNVTGGVQPYSYSWQPGGSNSYVVTGLAAGTLTQTVTDGAGCIKSFAHVVNQPAALAPVVTARQVCYGATTGSILVQPVGGTAPFVYSKDNGATFGTDSLFANLAAGTYQIVVKDAKNCVYATTSTVTVVSSNPNLNFLISSNQHAGDTLTMKEISWVKPDSVLWQFHPAATVVDPDRSGPKIKFPSPDTSNAYWVRLIGHYPNCTYTTQKFLRIYPFDPNAVVTPADFNRGIKKAELFPNPNGGQFTLNLEFYKLQRVTVYITDVAGHIAVPAQTFAPTLQLTRNYLSEMNNRGPGTYFLRIVSDYDSRNILFVKQ
jgi:large repetitive protein